PARPPGQRRGSADASVRPSPRGRRAQLAYRQHMSPHIYVQPDIAGLRPTAIRLDDRAGSPPTQDFRAVISQTALPNRTPSGVSCDRSAAFSFSCASARATSSRPSDSPLTIPIPPTNAYAASASAPNHSGSSNDVNSTASKPTPVSRASTSSGSASAAGPGAPGGGSGKSRPAAIDSRTTLIHSFLAVACQTNRAMRPPGRSAEA